MDTFRASADLTGALRLPEKAAGRRLGAVHLSRLQAVVESELRARNVPGAAVGLLHRGTMLYVKGFGVTDRQTASPVTEHTVFQIGSVSKLVTAIAIVLLAERGTIDLHAPIGRYVQGLAADLAALTAHQLLTHTAGLEDGGSLYGPRGEFDLRAALGQWDCEVLFTKPGEVFSYSNRGYALVGLLIECVAGRAFGEAMRDLLFAPLGMESTAVGMRIEPAFSAGHVGMRASPARPLTLLADNAAYRPAGYVHSTLHDLGRLLRTILEDGAIDGRQVLPPDVLRRVTKMYVNLPGQRHCGYGYGLYIDRRADRHIAAHTGFNAGFGARVSLCLQTRHAIVVLTNRQAETLPISARLAMEMLSPAPDPPKRATRGCAENHHGTPNAKYVGEYAQRGSPIVVWEEAGSLRLRFGTADLSLRRIGTHRFACSVFDGEPPVEVCFIREEDSAFRYVYIHSRVFRRQASNLVDA